MRLALDGRQIEVDRLLTFGSFAAGGRNQTETVSTPKAVILKQVLANIAENPPHTSVI